MTDKVNVCAKVCGLGKRCVIDPTPSEAVPEVPHAGSVCCRPLSPCSEVARTRCPESSPGAAATAGH